MFLNLFFFFYSGWNKKQPTAVQVNGLIQTIIVMFCCFFFLCVLTDETSFEAGIKVQIHTQNEPPFIDQLGFGVAPGFQTFVSCQEQRVSLTNTHTSWILYSKLHILADTSLNLLF